MPAAVTTPTRRFTGEPCRDATRDHQADAAAYQPGPQRFESEQVRDQRHDGADREHDERRDGRDPRRRLLGRVDAQLLNEMEVDRPTLVAVDLVGRRRGGLMASSP